MNITPPSVNNFLDFSATNLKFMVSEEIMIPGEKPKVIAKRVQEQILFLWQFYYQKLGFQNYMHAPAETMLHIANLGSQKSFGCRN